MTFTPTDYLPYDFANRRHIGPSPSEMDAMLKVVGAKDLGALIDDTLPKMIRQTEPLKFGKAKSERELLHHMKVTARKNKVLTSLIGQGYHGTVTPPAIQRNIFENPAWYTAYTPYQPEISQGRLEALLNFQTMVSDLTGLEIANASLLDEATACAEAMTMAQRVSKSKAVFGAIFQYPGTHGHVRDFTDAITALHETKAIGIIAADPLSLTLLKEPGEMGADIAVGSTQRFGLVSPSTATATAPTDFRYKPANNTSAARKPRQTSVPRRHFLLSWQAFTPSSMAPRACAPLPNVFTAKPRAWPKP